MRKRALERVVSDEQNGSNGKAIQDRQKSCGRRRSERKLIKRVKGS